ncbi:hypothetical protein K435DRAFT_905372 [Dendrothele bispora CBS 962.96]|uniref:Helicase C-terminal domain-containing protein n=1 Tax=Dendrothele bispora (strain CBS 962.96) TaxID=1314807 RepID=A0A4S8LTX9_DENBC|nr:hypothetical protein K435DRAFT_891015 [Dendrothele bispora CBS 962.96]THU92800.1 hypothetical protein K435DRAFT_905372 [Dendrothele bispora CBS 962.96]
MDFRDVKRVVLWHEPRTFLSLVQKIGRCVRNGADIGEAVIFITKTSYKQHVLDFDVNEETVSSETTANILESALEDEDTNNAPVDRVDAIDVDEATDTIDESSKPKSRRGKRKNAVSALEARDRRYLSYFIATNRCRREPWDEFFNNKNKMTGLYPRPPGFPCCDNCNPESFPVENISLSAPYPLRAGRAREPSPELRNALKNALQAWRDSVIDRDYANQSMIVGEYILDDSVIESIVTRVRTIKNPNIFQHVIPWGYGRGKYGEEVVKIVTDVESLYPDAEMVARQEAAREQAYQRLEAASEKEKLAKLKRIYEACYDAVYSVKTGGTVKVTRAGVRVEEPERRCRHFLALPRRNVS